MSFQADLYSPAWAHIALCADLTWTTESPDDFIVANQRLWAQNCRISQVLQDTSLESHSLQFNQSESDNKRTVHCQTQESCATGNRNVRDVIPESRLAQYYGDFYYNELRERCYTNPNNKSLLRGYNGRGYENSDLTECWMLPEVEFWFHKLSDDSDRSMLPRRRRQYKVLPGEDFEVNEHISTASERLSPIGAHALGAEAVLAARVHSVKALWTPQVIRPSPALPRTPSPPQLSRKIRARRRQPRRLTALAPPPPAYCLEVPAQLFCDPSCKFHFDSPRPPQSSDFRRVMGHLSLSVQAAMRASVIRCPPYRGTNVSRYAPTGQRPARYPDRRCGSSWPKNYPSPRLNHKFQLTHFQNIAQNKPITKTEQEETKQEDNSEKKQNDDINELKTVHHHENEKCETEQAESPKKESMDDNQSPSTSAATVDTGLRKKRLYSTVLSMSAPSPINLSPVVRLAQKLSTPGILKLNRKIILPSARIRPPNIEHKFEELEKEALEQYKASDESIDTKFHELEKQAVEQYSTSNSNTSCSSENSGGKKAADKNEKTRISSNSHKEKPVGSVVIYSQNFPDLNSKGASVTNLKNLHVPPRGEKKNHKSKVSRLKNDTQRAVSDTDNDQRSTINDNERGSNFSFKNDKSAMRWTLHVVPPKKRHLTLCVTDYSSDEEIEVSCRSIDAVPRIKNRAVLMKISAHGGGDLHPIMRKT